MHRARVILSSVACPALKCFSHKRHDFRKGGVRGVIEHRMCVLISYATFLWNISHFKKNWARCDQKCILVKESSRFSFPILMKLGFSRQFFEKYSTIKFHENPSSGSRVLPCQRTCMTNLIVAPCNFANSPKYSFKNHKRQNLHETSYEGTWFTFSLYWAVVILVFQLRRIFLKSRRWVQYRRLKSSGMLDPVGW